MSNVNRSTYQKVCEENKRLIKDIEILTRAEIMPSAEKILVVSKWRDKFKKDKQLSSFIKEIVDNIHDTGQVN